MSNVKLCGDILSFFPFRFNFFPCVHDFGSLNDLFIFLYFDSIDPFLFFLIINSFRAESQS